MFNFLDTPDSKRKFSSTGDSDDPSTSHHTGDYYILSRKPKNTRSHYSGPIMVELLSNTKKNKKIIPS